MEEQTKYRYFIELAYKGTHFHGWQIQPNAVSVQEVLNKALTTVLREEIETVGCGRTDTGVHATNFFAHFDTATEVKGQLLDVRSKKEESGLSSDETRKVIDSLRLVKAVNALVGYDIAVKRFISVAPEAHARFDAISRSYEYHVYFDKNPFKKEFGFLLNYNPNIVAMNKAAELIMTYTDFSCFSKSNTQTFTNNCKITKAEWVKVDGGLVFHITADRFLRNMVRAIVGTLLQVGRGELSMDEVKQVLESKSRSQAGESVPAEGLFLTTITYPYINN
ncbi:tRNA pseudouridine(38-40) synthase TruA [Solitalea lacus]|uniref:tRNA pseudouridine(38-40) synthase TruA n=1 Tax=Solitalea lacus TaxID=2911172 RepID=UPI001EDC437D|nr:tRNA pseudouridine(38-40) synthase TruA [Solitalea lacus]UKJ08628.1 tRNA pseudouridine(38-40) synthase TruA [Solitalea lacus]